MRADRTSAGFTLIELIVAISLSAIVVAFVAMITTIPATTYLAQSRRAEVSESASRISLPIERDLRMALPNSVRALTDLGANTVAVEMLATNSWVRFRDAAMLADPPERELDLIAGDDEFAVAGKFAVTRPFSSSTVYLATNNSGAAGDAYAFDDVITPAGTTINIVDDPTNANEDRVTLNPAVDFDDTPSPRRRMFLVTGPVLYLCDLNARTLRRYTGHAIQGALNAHNTNGELVGLGAASELVTPNVTQCTVSISPATATRGDLLNMEVTVTVGGDSTVLMFQGHVGTPP